MRRFRDQETTLEQVYLADLVAAVERLTDVIAERIPRADPEPVFEPFNMNVDGDEEQEPDVDDEPPRLWPAGQRCRDYGVRLMAAGWIPKPTTGKKAIGPCAPDCHRWTLKHAPLKVIAEGESHTDCASLRQQAASLCRLCSKPIRFEVRMYADPEHTESLVHAVCLESEGQR